MEVQCAARFQKLYPGGPGSCEAARKTYAAMMGSNAQSHRAVRCCVSRGAAASARKNVADAMDWIEGGAKRSAAALMQSAPAAQPSSATVAEASPAELPWCSKLRDLYCTGEYLTLPQGPAVCAQASAQFHAHARGTPEARVRSEQTCQLSYEITRREIVRASSSSTASETPVRERDPDTQHEPHRAARAGTQPSRLRVVHGPDAGLEAQLPEAGVVVGAAKTCDVVLTDPAVSSRHFSVKKVAHGFVVSDLESRNGTFFDGAALVKATVPAGATLRVGGSILQLVPEEEVVEIPPSDAATFGGLVGASLASRRASTRCSSARLGRTRRSSSSARAARARRCARAPFTTTAHDTAHLSWCSIVAPRARL